MFGHKVIAEAANPGYSSTVSYLPRCTIFKYTFVQQLTSRDSPVLCMAFAPNMPFVHVTLLLINLPLSPASPTSLHRWPCIPCRPLPISIFPPACATRRHNQSSLSAAPPRIAASSAAWKHADPPRMLELSSRFPAANPSPSRLAFSLFGQAATKVGTRLRHARARSRARDYRLEMVASYSSSHAERVEAIIGTESLLLLGTG